MGGAIGKMNNDHTDSDHCKWYVLYTRSRHEKKVAEGLVRKGFEVFCPLVQVPRKWSDRVKIVEEPLFRSYCFIRLAEKERASVFEVPGIVRYVYWLQKPAIIKTQEIDAIRKVLKEFDHTGITARNYLENELVRIKTGILSDHTGLVKEQRGNYLIIYLETLQMAVSVELTKIQIEKISNRKPKK